MLACWLSMLRTCMLPDANVPFQSVWLDRQYLPHTVQVAHICTLLLLMMCNVSMASHHSAHLLLQVLYVQLEPHVLLLHLCSSYCVLSLCTLSICSSR